MDAADDDNPGTALYAPWQTILYTAPAIVHGRIPKNVYGNLDVYVPSMVPRGGAHIQHPETARAARIIGIDYADAVTGFSFRGRHGTAVTNGAVVAAEYREAVEEVIKAFEDERAQAEQEKRSLAARTLWKRFLVGLRIRQRIESYDIEGERDAAMRREMEKVEVEDEENNEGGGFLPDRDADEIAQPTAKTVLMRNTSDLGNDDSGGGFCMSEDEQEEVETPQASDRFLSSVRDDVDDDAGGFGVDTAEEKVRSKTREKIYHGDSHENTDSAAHTSADVVDRRTLGQEGGFLPDDHDISEDPLADDSTRSSKLVDSILEDNASRGVDVSPQNEEQLQKALSNMPVAELEDATVLQQLYESQGSRHLPRAKGGVTAPTTSKSPEPSPVPVQATTVARERETSANPSEKTSSNECVAEDPAPDSSEEDKGSLLSHDPDDEDADPEWLA